MIKELSATRVSNFDERILVDGERAFEKVLAAFNHARRKHRHRVIDSYYSFAGLRTRFEIVGHELSQHIAAPFVHLSTSGRRTDPVELAVDLWDEKESEIPYPEELADLVEGVSGSNLERRIVIGDREDRFIVCQCRSMITWLDRARQHMVGWVSAGDRLSLYEKGHPLRFPLLLWHADRGIQVLHAGCVAKDGYGIILAGKAGSGKTTAALSCVRAGFDYLGDDYVAINGLEQGNFKAYSLYNSAWLEPTGSCFPLFASNALQATFPHERRAAVLISGVFPKRLACSAKISGIIIPRQIAGLTSRIRPASKGCALLAVAPTSVIRLPSLGDSSLQVIGQLIESVPCYWMEMSSNLEEIPNCVESALFRNANPHSLSYSPMGFKA